MKKFTVLIFALLLISCSSDDSIIIKKSQSEIRKELGFTEAKVYSYFYEDGNLENKILKEIHIFDEDGNSATIIMCDDEGEPYCETVYKYNKAYMPIESIVYNMDGNKLRTEIMKYYPGDTLMIESILEGYYDSEDDQPTTKYEYKYNDKGHEIYSASYEKEILQKEWITENVYNDKNQLIKTIKTEKIVNSKREPPEITDFIDEKGNVLNRSKKFNGNGQIIEEDLPGYEITKIKYKYNEKGLLEEQIMCTDDGQPLIGMIYEYK